MLRYDFTEPLFTDKHYAGKSCGSYITPENADWYHLQIKRNITMAIGIANAIRREYFVEWHLPPNLKSEHPESPSWTECTLYILALKTFYKYISEFDAKTLSISMGAVAGTKIKVQKNRIMVFSEDLNVQDCIKNAVREEGYRFKKVTNSETKSWWEPITKEW